MKELKIAVVVVTFNRIQLLKRLIEKLYLQTRRVNEIIVVDNGSTDGTQDWLANQDNIISVFQNNTGSAGGFYTGFSLALKNNADFIWAMDDDGFPNKHALNHLIANIKDQKTVLASVCVSDSDFNELSFRYRDPQSKEVYFLYNSLIQKYGSQIENWANPYNSILFPKEVLKNIGLPNPKLFIWGDEAEYYARLIKNNVHFLTILNSIHYHPKDRQIRKLFLRRNVYSGPADWKAYCYYRNMAFMARQNGISKLRFRRIIIPILYNFKRSDIIEATKDSWLIFKAYLHGAIGYLDKKIPF